MELQGTYLNVLKAREGNRSHYRYSIKSIFYLTNVSEVDPVLREKLVLVHFAMDCGAQAPIKQDENKKSHPNLKRSV